MSKKKLAIFGAGGLGRELKAWIQKMDQYTLIGFFDDNLKRDSAVDGLKVLGGMKDIKNFGELHLVIAIGSPGVRAELIPQLATIPDLYFPSFIHPRAIIDDVDTVRIGKGTVITGGCVLTTNIVVGDHVLINLNTTIGHDCVIGEGTCIMPGVHLSGHVTIGKHVLMGTGATVLNTISIGDNTKVGAGAVVTRSLPPDCTAVGVPANPIKK